MIILFTYEIQFCEDAPEKIQYVHLGKKKSLKMLNKLCMQINKEINRLIN